MGLTNRSTLFRIINVLIGICSIFPPALAQDRVIDKNFNTWWTNVNRYNLSEQWYLSSEVHVRRTDGLERWQQFLFRPAINYILDQHVHMTAGYTYIMSYPYGDQPIAIKTPENNFWEEITLRHSSGKVSFIHRYRLEHRFIGKTVENGEGKRRIEGTEFAQRFRYRFTGNFPIAFEGRFFGAWFDEVWINLGDDLMPLSFNQNWLYGGVGYKVSERGRLQLGYMHQLIRKSDGIHYESNPTIQFTAEYQFGKLAN